jgi:hypothetical protein
MVAAAKACPRRCCKSSSPEPRQPSRVPGHRAGHPFLCLIPNCRNNRTLPVGRSLGPPRSKNKIETPQISLILQIPNDLRNRFESHSFLKSVKSVQSVVLLRSPIEPQDLWNWVLRHETSEPGFRSAILGARPPGRNFPEPPRDARMPETHFGLPSPRARRSKTHLVLPTSRTRRPKTHFILGSPRTRRLKTHLVLALRRP